MSRSVTTNPPAARLPARAARTSPVPMSTKSIHRRRARLQDPCAPKSFAGPLVQYVCVHGCVGLAWRRLGRIQHRCEALARGECVRAGGVETHIPEEAASKPTVTPACAGAELARVTLVHARTRTRTLPQTHARTHAHRQRRSEALAAGLHGSACVRKRTGQRCNIKGNGATYEIATARPQRIRQLTRVHRCCPSMIASAIAWHARARLYSPRLVWRVQERL